MPELCAWVQQCAYGLGRGVRCANTFSDKPRVSFQKVPRNATVLSHLGVADEQWTNQLRCCSDHGQDANVAPSPVNLASRTSAVRPLIQLAATPVKRKSPDVINTDVYSSDRQRLKEENRECLKKSKAAADASTASKKRLDAANAILQSEDAPELVATICEQLEELTLRLAKSEELRKEDRAAAEEVYEWSNSVPPMNWDDVDDAWVNTWTPFFCKPVAQAYYQVSWSLGPMTLSRGRSVLLPLS